MNFKKTICGLLTAASIFSLVPVSEAANIKDFPRVAVMEFGNKAITSKGLRDHDFASATEYAIYQLSACGWFDLVDYEQLSTAAKMHAINMSGLVDPSTAVQMGKFAGAQFMVIGNVTGLTTKENVLGVSGSNVGGINNGQHVVNANVALRIVDIETGRIVVAGLGKGSSTSTSTEINFKKYRNRKVETEQITNRKTNDKKNEFTRNDVDNTKTTYSKDKNRTKTDTDSSTVKTHSEDWKTRNSTKVQDTDITDKSYKKNTTKNTLDEKDESKKSSGTTDDLKQNLKGDVNGDGTVDKYDIEVMEAVLNGQQNDDLYIATNADVDGDGQFNQSDIDTVRAAVNNGTASSLGYSTTSIPSGFTNSSSEEKNKNKYSEDYSEDVSDITKITKDDLTVEDDEGDKNTKDTEASKSSKVVDTEGESLGVERNQGTEDTYHVADNTTTIDESTKNIHYEREEISYTVMIGTVEVSDVQVRNAISKAVRDAVYGNMGIMTTLNNGKKLKLKTGF